MFGNRLLILFLTAALLAGCSREGFSDSLVRIPSLSPSLAENNVTAPPSVDQPFTIGDGHLTGNGYDLLFAQPQGEGDMEASAAMITARIQELLKQLPEFFDMTAKGATLSLLDGINKNDGIRFSVTYEGEYNSTALPHPTRFAFGLTFNAKTGRQLSLSDVAQPHTLAALLLDAQSSTLKGRDPEQLAAQRKALSNLGLTTLSERILAAAPQQTIDQLMTFSFALEESRLIAILPVEHAIGDVAFLSVPNGST